MTNTKDITALTFETALGELETIVRALEKGDTPLEESINAYERGIALKEHCATKLREAQSKIEKITLNKNGAPQTEPLDA